MNQVHKEQLTAVDNSLPNRAGLEVEIFGMEGIPEDVVQQHQQRMLQNFYEAQAERRAKSGNLAPGEPSKRKKLVIESPEELKKRFDEWRKKKAAGMIDSVMGGTQEPTQPTVNSPAPVSGDNPTTVSRSTMLTPIHRL